MVIVQEQVDHRPVLIFAHKIVHPRPVAIEAATFFLAPHTLRHSAAGQYLNDEWRCRMVAYAQRLLTTINKRAIVQVPFSIFLSSVSPQAKFPTKFYTVVNLFRFYDKL